MSSSQNSESVPSSPQDMDVITAMLALMEIVPWNSSSSIQWSIVPDNEISATFDEEQFSVQRKILIELVTYMKTNGEYIDNVIFNISKERDIIHEHMDIVSRHIEHLKTHDAEGFKKYIEYAISERDNCCKILSSLEDIEIEFKKISNDLLKEHKTMYNDLKLIIQNPTFVENYECHFFNQIVDLFKIHADYCSTMSKGGFDYWKLYSELENEFRNKDTRLSGYYATKLKNDLELLKFYANEFFFHKENSNGHMIWFEDFTNKATTLVKDLKDLVGKQIEINRLK